MTICSGKPMVCPHCEKQLEGNVDDYAIAGRIGDASEAEDQCCYCDGWFSVMKVKDDLFNVTEIV